MLERIALSTAFWSAARTLATFFFCRHNPVSDHSSLPWLLPVARITPPDPTYLWLLSLLEESLFTLLLGLLVLGEVTLLRNLLESCGVDTSKVDLQASGDDIAGVDAAERDTVDLEGAGDEENTLGEVLEENDTLAAEATSEEDEDGTGLKAGTGLGGVDGLANLFFKMSVLVRGDVDENEIVGLLQSLIARVLKICVRIAMCASKSTPTATHKNPTQIVPSTPCDRKRCLFFHFRDPD